MNDEAARAEREREFYNAYAESIHDEPVSTDLTERWTKGERRPWNSYWDFYDRLLSTLAERKISAPILEVGCGVGFSAAQVAGAGYSVKGFDISDRSIELAKERTAALGLAERTEFRVASATELPYADGEFEVAFGVDILHHIPVADSMAELKRVLRPGGVAFFREPIDVPLFDRIRNTALGRKLVPKNVGLEHHVTEDEKKLDQDDLAAIREHFPEMEVARSLVFSRFVKVLPLSVTGVQKMDQGLLKVMPFLGRYGGAGVITLRKH